ncbi:cytochrome P450 [Mycena haematopus]|nr:cytochrome P450 [Mycena haematopus]
MVGPSSPSLLLGNFMQLADDGFLMDKWRRKFGPNFVFKGLFGVRELHTSDTKAIGHIITRSVVYQKAPFNLYAAKQFFGNGLLGVELEDHRRQNPAFSVAQIRHVSEISVEKAVKLRDIWNAKITDHSPPTVEVLSWLRRMTLDVIGEAGFNYHFHNLDDKPSELNQVLTQLFHSPTAQRDNAFRLMQAMVPILRLVPLPGRQLFHNARAKMSSIGRELVKQSKQAAIKEAAGELYLANTTVDIPDRRRLSDEEVIGRHETTSVATAWALHSLSLNQEVQTKLREEVLAISSDTPTMDELNDLVYLECVVRENIIRRGQMIHIPILAVNTDKEIWGPDAEEFKPERWENISKAAHNVPGMWANLLTFFAGPHNCIGFRFALIEQKALLFTLIRAFEFENAVPEGGIGRSSTSLQRPVVLADRNKTGQMPLIVKRYCRS